MRKLWPVTLILLLAAACGELPGTPPAHGPTAGAPRPSAPMPPTDTPIPYPLPPTVPYWLTPEAQPTAMAGPTPIVLGAAWAPESEREVYVSTTVVVAPVGDGPGEIGYWEAPEAGRVWADRFTVDTNGNIYILDKVNHRVARFGPEGEFVANTPYDSGWYVVQLAADDAGNVYLLRPDDGVQVLDLQGVLLREYSKPAEMYGVRGIIVDEQGVLWIVGDESYPDAPIIEGQPYPVVTVPLGKLGEAFDERQQRAMTLAGHALSSGSTIIAHSLGSGGPAFLYDEQGHRVYEVPLVEGVSGIDQRGNLYTVEDNVIKVGETDTRINRLRKYDSKGRLMASFDLSTALAHYTEALVDNEGTVYTLVWSFDTQDAYRVIRWQRK